MEFEGEEYSKEVLEELRRVYLTVPDFGSYPSGKELGITKAKAYRLLEVIVPKPTLESIEDVWALCKEYDPVNPRMLGRILRNRTPFNDILSVADTEDRIREMYVENNMTLEEVKDSLNFPPVVTKKVLHAFLFSRGIYHKPEDKRVNSSMGLKVWLNDPVLREQMMEKRQATSLERYGKKHPMQSEQVQMKSKQTNTERYGVPYTFQTKEMQAKSMETSIKRYGFPYPMQSKVIQTKAQQTLMEHYNVLHPSQSPIIQEKAIQTNMERHGLPNGAQLKGEFTPTDYVESFLECVRITENPDTLRNFLYKTFPDKKQYTLHEIARIVGRPYSFIKTKFGTNLDFIAPSVQGHLPEQVQLFLEELGYVAGKDFFVNDRVALKPREIDFYFPKQKVGIEVNDLLTHNSTYNPYTNDSVKSKNYHMEKSLKAKEQGIRLIHAWEHYFNNPQQYEVLKNAIKHALGISKYRVYARNTYVKEVPNVTLKDFFNTNNIQGFRGAKTAYALFDKKTDEVLMAYSVGASHFAHNKYDMELIRGASKLDTTIVGGASKLWKFIIDSNPEVNSIVYYIDRNIYNGSSIGTLEGNLELISTQVGFWNYFVDAEEMKNRQPAKHKEIKELVAQGKVWEVYNAGTETYVWTRS